MNVRCRDELSQVKRTELKTLLNGGKNASRKLKLSQIFWRGQRRGDSQERWRGGSNVYQTKRLFLEGSVERTLSEWPGPGAERKLTGKEEALLVVTACAGPPKGRARWTLKLLAGAMVK